MPTLRPARVTGIAKPSHTSVFLVIASTLALFVTLTTRTSANLDGQGLAETICAALQAGT